jgi:alpha-ketoglutarate-dependent taurine dioxygenase
VSAEGNLALDAEPFALGADGLPRLVQPLHESGPRELGEAVRARAAELLESSGAVLLRGFAIDGLAAFQELVQLVTPGLLSYDFASTPRSQVERHIYTSTEYPAHQSIPLHNEQSYTSEWPLKLWFHCAQAAQEGGHTPLADSRAVLCRIPQSIRERFERKGVMYVRNYGNGLDLPWTRVFQTQERAEVERFCRRAGIACEWKADGELRTRQVCPAIAVHPSSGERVWFNQAHLFHVSSLEPTLRDALLGAVEEAELPRHALYGDGSPIEPEALEAIREAYRLQTAEFPWQQGDVLLLDNMRVAHGRTPYKGARKILVAMAEPWRTEA